MHCPSEAIHCDRLSVPVFHLEAVSKLWQEVLKSAASGESEASAIPGDYDVDPRDPGRA
jgi:hypothetical protein